MAAKFKVGSKARISVKVIEGIITDRIIDDDDEIRCKLEWEENGEPHHRYFLEDELELV